MGQSTVIESVLPQVMRAVAASTVDAVSGRIEQATSSKSQAAALSFGGASTLSDVILANGQALEDGTFDLSRLLANSAFTLPLNAADSGNGGLFGNLALWGSGDYRSVSGGSPQSVGYDGSVTGANLGVDTRLGADLLAGMSLGQTRGTVDYTDPNAQTGELTTSVTSVNPYLGWQMPGGMNLWAMAGFGSGEVEIADSTGTQSSDLTQRTFAVGVSGTLMSSDEMFEGGTTTLRLKGEAAFTSTDVDGSGTLESMSLSASRQRLTVEGSHDQELASGASFTPSLELGLRNDGGDGETGTGVEAGGGLRYFDAESGLTVEGRVRTLVNHSGDYEETGVSGLVRDRSGVIRRGAHAQRGAGVGPDRQRRAAVVGARRQRGSLAGQRSGRARACGGRLRSRRGARSRAGDALRRSRTCRRRCAVVAHGRALAGGVGREPEPRGHPARGRQRRQARARPDAARRAALVTPR